MTIIRLTIKILVVFGVIAILEQSNAGYHAWSFVAGMIAAVLFESIDRHLVRRTA